MEHPIVLAAFLGVVAFFVWVWIDNKRPALEPEFRPGYLAVRRGLRWVGPAIKMIALFLLTCIVVRTGGPMAILLIIGIPLLAGMLTPSRR